LLWFNTSVFIMGLVYKEARKKGGLEFYDARMWVDILHTLHSLIIN
jgi:hypothetical protein